MADRPPRTDDIPAPETREESYGQTLDSMPSRSPGKTLPGANDQWGIAEQVRGLQPRSRDSTFDPARFGDDEPARNFPGHVRLDWDKVGASVMPGPMAQARQGGMMGTRPVPQQPRAATPDELSREADRMMGQIRAQQAASSGGSYVGQLTGLDRQVPPKWLDEYMASEKSK